MWQATAGCALLAAVFYFQFSMERNAHDQTKAQLVVKSVEAEVGKELLRLSKEKQAEQIKQIEGLGNDLNEAQNTARLARTRNIEVQARLEWMAQRQPFEAGHVAAELLCNGLLGLYTAAGGSDGIAATRCGIRSRASTSSGAVPADRDNGGSGPS